MIHIIQRLLMNILVTGGAGFIGSHTCIELLNAGYDVIVVDNLSNSSEISLIRVGEITGRDLRFYKIDILDKDTLEKVFATEHIDAVIHFAGLKCVPESITKPLEYYNNNITGTLNLCDLMKKYDVKNMIFSSSATVYGEPVFLPITEDCPKGMPTNPYGMTKWMIEEILKDLCRADAAWNVILLRYFNPIGAHESGLIGEDPKGIPNNLLPYITQVAIGKREYLNIYGDDYDTPDGTCIRDYIHVVDLAKGHAMALNKIRENCGLRTYNLGTGNGYSVINVLRTFEKVCGVKIPYKVVGRRPGDIMSCYADASLAEKELDWKAVYDIEQMCRDAWNWQSKNPDGYREN